MSSVFLFGAGASYGSGACNPHPPPLGRKLFSALQAEDGIAASVDSDLAAMFLDDFEAGMDQFWKERNSDTTQLLREMAAYFARFEPLSGNAYIELLKILGRTRKKATFVTTNYDLLIEIAAAKVGLNYKYSGFPVPVNNIPLLKIHGSCNFLPDIPTNTIRGIRFDLGGSSGPTILQAGVRPAQSPAEILRFCQEEDSIAPALAMYSQDKGVLFCREFIMAQQNAWKTSLRNSARIYVIGLRVHPIDSHIWEPLVSATVPLFYVGQEPTDFVNWAKDSKRKKACVLAETFQDALPLIAGHLGQRWPV